MKLDRRFSRALLALWLAASFVVLSGHATAHYQSGVEQCLMCSSHADPHHAMPATMPAPVAGVNLPVAFIAFRVSPVRSSACSCPQSRAPPALS